MRRARLLAVASGGVLALGAPLGALAATTASAPASPAPPGESEGYVVQVGSQSQPIAAVSHTKASSSNGSSSSSAGVVELGGKPLGHPFGGSTSQHGTGHAHDSDALLDTKAILGTASPVRLQVTPWTSDSSVTDNGSSASSAMAEAANLNVGGDSGVTLDVLKSQSASSYDTATNGGGGSSTGQTSTDGAILNAGGSGGLTVDVLHSDASTSADGTPAQHAYVASINGNQILSDSQVQDVCKNLDIQGLLGLNCVQASGGPGHALAQDLGATIGGNGGANSGLPLNLSTATASSGPGPSGALVSAAAPSTGSPAPAAAPAGNATPSNKLPFTGAPLEFLALAAAALLTLGAVVVQLANRLVPGLLR